MTPLDRIGRFIVCCIATLPLPFFLLIYAWDRWRATERG